MINYKQFDQSTLIVALITFILFVLALFTKGFTHDLLLEAGVFLVSVKLMLATYTITVQSNRIEKKIDQINADLQKKK